MRLILRRNVVLDQFDIIYADPPWRYDFTKSDSRAIENQYPTMSVEDICGLKVPAAPNSILYMWATAPKLREALRVMEAWGFEYKTHGIWDKEIIGMGYWWRGQHELLLVGVRGKMSPPAQVLRIGSVMKHRRSKHSKKPIEIRELINQWYPTQSKIEMFAREAAPGWAVWGNEVKSTFSLDVLSHS